MNRHTKLVLVRWTKELLFYVSKSKRAFPLTEGASVVPRKSKTFPRPTRLKPNSKLISYLGESLCPFVTIWQLAGFRSRPGAVGWEGLELFLFWSLPASSHRKAPELAAADKMSCTSRVLIKGLTCITLHETCIVRWTKEELLFTWAKWISLQMNLD